MPFTKSKALTRLFDFLLSMWGGCIKTGALIINDAEGRRHELGDGTGAPVEFTLHESSLYWKILISPRLALGEAYMDGILTFQQGDAYDLAGLISHNVNNGQKLPPLMRLLEHIVRQVSHLLQFNYPGKSRKNVAAHYEFTDALYDLFMDANLQYSCGYFTEEHGDIERAQRDKIRHIAGKLRLEPGLKVLDIGCGWGDLACVLAKETGCHVTGIALAEEQIKRAKERAKRDGVEHLTDFRLEDYRHHQGEAKYDRVVSVGMMEHVGLMYYEKFMQCVNKFLKDDGVAMVHHIVRLKGRNVMDPFVLKYIFLNCYTPTLSEVTPRVERSGLMVTDIEIWRLHYNKTILLWRKKWRANKAKVLEMYDERLYRMFEHYLSTAAAGFNMRDFAVMHLQMAKRMDTVPLTRDYITEFQFKSDDKKPQPEAPAKNTAQEAAMLLVKAWSDCVKKGALTFTDAHGKRYELGDGAGAPVALTLHDPSLHWKLLLRPRAVFSEAYMDKRITFEQGNVFDFFDLMGRNLASGERQPFTVTLIEKMAFLAKPIWQLNFIQQSKKNVEHHYDISDELYELFLDSNMQYTCGYFTEDHGDIERAQKDKMQHLAAKLMLKPGDKVLDIGCGWGGLACTLARETGCHVTGLTLSEVQLNHAKKRAKREGVEHLFNPVLEDYRHHKGKYDRVIVVGMMEHVGLPFYDKFMACIRDFLKDDGVAVVHCVTRLKGPALVDAHLRKYIFPGSYTPALSEITPRVERNGLILADIELWRMHYAKTLRLWREKFMARAKEIEEMYDERFVRMFEYYMAISEAGFIHRGMAIMHLQMSKRIDAVPVTRDYITNFKFSGKKSAAA